MISKNEFLSKFYKKLYDNNDPDEIMECFHIFIQDILNSHWNHLSTKQQNLYLDKDMFIIHMYKAYFSLDVVD